MCQTINGRGTQTLYKSKARKSDWNLTPVNRSNRPAFQFVVKALCDGFFIVKYYLLIFTKLISIGCKEVYM